jgi:predicted ABC-type ATPase
VAHIYIIAGPNGAGKTTFAKEFLPHFAKCDEFVNADLIASGLSPFSPGETALQAGRLMLQRIHDLALKNKDFGFETTLSGKSYLPQFRKLRQQGYKIHLIFLWLPNVNLAIKRVEDRVRQGGHHVPEDVIRRRFDRGVRNFFANYQVLSDTWIIYDNSGRSPLKIAFGAGRDEQILDQDQYALLKKKAGRV